MIKKLKIVIDIVMTVLFIIVMGYHHTGAIFHEWFGIVLVVLFLFHNLINLKWYATIPKGKYSFQRVMRLIINIMLLMSFIGAMMSGIMMSKYLFGFLNLRSTMFARRLHMLSTSWCFLFMSIHLGMHWSMVIMTFKKYRMKKWLLQSLTLICTVLGCYVFIEKELWNELFLLVDFVFLDYQEPFPMFVIKQMILMSPFILLGQRLLRHKKSQGGKKDE